MVIVNFENATRSVSYRMLKYHVCTTNRADFQPLVPVEGVEGRCEALGMTESWTR